jgi:hypothetical protein
MEQLEQDGDFAADCRRLFAPKHGRRWKTAAADALAIGRTTLYRYLNGEQLVPAPVRAPSRPRQTAGQALRDPDLPGRRENDPEQHIAGPSRPFTGAEYIESLRMAAASTSTASGAR